MTPTEPNQPLQESPTGYHPGSLRDVFTPRHNYRVTPILMLVNIAVFAIMVISGVNFMNPSAEDLVQWGANYTAFTRAGEPWRLLTACFLHIGIIHLAVNMMSLRYLGMQIEPLLGSWRFLVAYIATGLTGSLGSLWWHDVAVSAGASGAIFGIEGVLLALVMTNLFTDDVRKALLKSTLSVVGINLLIGMSIGADNAAHIGGLLGGIVCGMGFYAGIRAELGWPVPKWMTATWFAIGLPVAMVIVAALLIF
ncbi:rhomboid family intramembrane serine protease [Fibrivirga algicola]|uniref:Rhomboid family intramembrane serine protease n=1 Tax=Fibrivirga algicola TaxID=2950420 RepID=A0ABX0QDP5_9BACT|nr:rhomboid family intramembrane serine protease [Fibrivirga algicola]NID10092.1 rhomboid family intramembrane serine protease [Fibrivirga algicola]